MPYALYPLPPRHRTIAYLLAVGRKQVEIASILNYNVNSIHLISKRPEVIEEVNRLQTELKGSTFALFLEKIDSERLATLDRLIQLRDTGTKDDNVMLGAAKALLDYDPVLAIELNKAEKDGRDVLRVSLPRNAMVLMATAELELAGRPVPSFVDTTCEPVQLAPPVGGLRAKTPEEIEEEYGDDS